jgi:hypothetical protein
MGTSGEVMIGIQNGRKTNVLRSRVDVVAMRERNQITIDCAFFFSCRCSCCSQLVGR